MSSNQCAQLKREIRPVSLQRAQRSLASNLPPPMPLAVPLETQGQEETSEATQMPQDIINCKSVNNSVTDLPPFLSHPQVVWPCAVMLFLFERVPTQTQEIKRNMSVLSAITFSSLS